MPALFMAAPQSRAASPIDFAPGARSKLAAMLVNEGTAMEGHDGGAAQLGAAVLGLFVTALAQGRLAIAEHLMEALEELAISEPACDELVQRAYLCMAGAGACGCCQQRH